MVETLRKGIQTALVAMGVGAAVSSFYAVAEWPDGFWTIIFIGTVIGLCIYVCVGLLHLLFGNAVERLRPAPHLAARTLLFLAGGIGGSMLGLVTGVGILGSNLSFADVLTGRGRPFIILSAGIALMVGFALRAFELMRAQLMRTVAQLKEREWAEKELELARAIQTRLLPPPLIEEKQFTIASRNLAAHFVAGDFYDVVRLEDGSIVIAVADVAGKGLGASLIMASVKAMLPFVAREGARQAMITLNEKLVRDLGRREFIALAFARFTPADGDLELLNAGFPDPYVVSAGGVRALSVPGPRLPLGVRSGIEYETLRVRVASGERVVFVSDGIPEAPVKGEPLGYERLEAILGTLSGHAGGAEWLEAFLAQIRASVDEGLEDDWTAVVLEYR